MVGYRELLQATIAHLEHLRAQGARFVSLQPSSLAELTARRPDRRPKTYVGTGSGGGAAAVEAVPDPSARRVSAPLPASVTARWNHSANPAVPPKPATTPLPPNVDPPPARLDPVAQAAALQELRRRALACVKCPNLVASRKTVVFGVGDPLARLMFVGEAPGADEDAQGEPFVGKAGELLTRIIEVMGLKRSEVYIANILKCRPDTPGQTAGNRKPTADEMATCVPWLQEQINLIRPEVMVALGATAVEGLLGKTLGITKLRGQWQIYRGIPLMPTYHPAYLLRNQAPSEKRKVWEDMMAVMGKLRMPISDKQKGYFLGK